MLSLARHHRSRLGFERLEERDVPASVAIKSLEVTDPADNIIDPNLDPLYVGEQMFFRITYEVTDLPDDATYGISVGVSENPVPGYTRTLQTNSLTDGAGQAGANTFVINTATSFDLRTWYAQEFNDIRVDIYSISGTGFNNAATAYFSVDAFEPANTILNFNLGSPISGVQGKSWVVPNGVDYDPELNTIGSDATIDSKGGTFTRDSQTYLDYQVADYSAADQGVNVVAAAAGRVSGIMTGFYDRNYDLQAPAERPIFEAGNYVIIDHGQGWFTQYFGLRNTTSKVAVGDKVNAGQVIGQVAGSSLPTPGARLGFSFYYERTTGSKSYFDPTAELNKQPIYFTSTSIPNYAGLAPVSLGSGTTNYDFTTDPTANGERPASVATFSPGQTVYFYSNGSQNIGSSMAVTFFDPSNNAVSTTPSKASSSWARTTGSYSLPPGAANGTWRAILTVNGVQVATQNFTVSNSVTVPTIKVNATQPVGPPTGSFFFAAGRLTGLNFGSWTSGTPSPEATLTVQNIGTAPLVISSSQITAGFKFLTLPVGPIAPGDSTTITIIFDGTLTGTLEGQFRLSSNDPLTPFFDGSLRGVSRASGGGGAGSTGNVTNPTLNNPLAGTLLGINGPILILSPGLAPGAATKIVDNSFAVSTDAGSEAEVVIFTEDGDERFRVKPFPGFTGGARATMADFNGDGVADLAVGTGPGLSNIVQIYDGRTTRLITQFQPFEESFTGGVFVTTGDLNGDGVPDLVITPDQGGGPRVRVLDGQLLGQGKVGTVLDFLGIDDANFRGGARTAVGDLNGDGVPDLVVSAGFGGGPRIAAFDGKSLQARRPARLFSDFFAFELGLRNGVYITTGDVDGDGFDDLIVGGGPGGGPRVTVFSSADLLANKQSTIANFFAGDSSQRNGVRLSVRDLAQNSEPELLVGAGSGQFSQLKSYPFSQLTKATPVPDKSLTVFPGFSGGVFVG